MLDFSILNEQQYYLLMTLYIVALIRSINVTPVELMSADEMIWMDFRDIKYWSEMGQYFSDLAALVILRAIFNMHYYYYYLFSSELI